MCDVANCQDGDVLVLWLDAMEQAKFALPRHRGLRTASATFLTQKILDLVQNMSNTCMLRANIFLHAKVKTAKAKDEVARMLGFRVHTAAVLPGRYIET